MRIISMWDKYLQGHWQCIRIYSDTNKVTVYKYLQWHQHSYIVQYLQWHKQSDSVQISTVKPTQWQWTSIYSDTNTMTVYKYLQRSQHSDSVQVSTVKPTQWQCTSIYSDTNKVTVYKYLQWLPSVNKIYLILIISIYLCYQCTGILYPYSSKNKPDDRYMIKNISKFEFFL